MADKKGRIQAVIQKNLSEIILYNLKDEITKFASVTEVRLAADYSFCKVYVSHINTKQTSSLADYLNKRAPMIRSMLSKKLDIYKTPELRFYPDTIYDESLAMEKKIEEAINRKPKTLKDVFPDIQIKEDEE